MKLSAILLGFIFTILLLSGCAAANPQAPTDEHTTDQTTTVPTDTTEPTYDYEQVPYISRDINAFLQEWHQAQIDPGKSSGTNVFLNNDSEKLVVPALQSTEYEFWFVEVNEYNYMYYYMPVKSDTTYFDYSVGLVVYFSKESNSFSAVMDQFNLTPINGVAHHSQNSAWYIDFDGTYLCIDFPDNIILNDFELVSNYFTFTEYSAADSDSSVIQ